MLRAAAPPQSYLALVAAAAKSSESSGVIGCLPHQCRASIADP